MEKDILYKFFEGQATDEEIQTIKEWADESEDNSKTLYRERRLYNALLLVGKPNQLKKSFWGTDKTLTREILKIAATILLTFGITAFLFSVSNHGNEDNSLAMQTISVPSGQRVNLRLPDGTDVWLNSGTTMTYPVSFAKSTREVQIDGEAYFDVAHKANQPFIVKTYAMRVQVLGTQFNLAAYKKNKIFEASLLQGSIQINTEDNTPLLKLSPYEKATLINQKLVKGKIQDYDIFRWKEGLFCFKDLTFDELLKEFERYYDIRIIVKKEVLSKNKLTGKFRISDGLEYALNILKNEVNFTYQHDIEKNIIFIN